LFFVFLLTNEVLSLYQRFGEIRLMGEEEEEEDVQSRIIFIIELPVNQSIH